jgi:hypothetical protein
MKEEPNALAHEPIAARTDEDARTPLFHEEELTGYRARWGGIQTGFVDEPRRAVTEADALVSELTTRLTQSFAEERSQLEARWDKAENISTEDLRQAMRRYRSFFERLLKV